MTLGSAAVLAIYAAGYVRTKPAADRMAAASAASDRRQPRPLETASAPTSAPVTEPAGQLAVTTLQAPPVVETASPVDVPKPAVVAIAKPHPAKSPASAKDSVVETAADSGATSHSSAPASTASEASSASHSTPAVSIANASVAQSSVSAPPPATEPPATTAAAASPAVPPKPVFVDGVYQGRGTSRHGDIEATVEIKDGRITSAVISQCLTRYSCSWVSHLLPQVVARQSAEVDYVSGATESANALYYAVLKALSQAK